MFLYSNKIVQNDIDEIINKRYIYFEKLKDKTVLITGANGMLAYYFACVLMHLNFKKKLNIKVIAAVRNLEKAKKKYSGFLDNNNFKLIKQDVCNPINIEEKINFILHAASTASPYFIKNDPVGIIKANTIGMINVLELARHNKIDNVLFTSTREVYGKISDLELIKENDMGILDPLDSRSCYPESKRIAEQICKSYYLQYNIPFTIARIAHSYGPGMEINKDGRVMSDFISDIVNNRNIILKSDGKAVRAFCYISDAVSALFLILLNGKIGEVYNVANETEPIEIREIAQQLVGLEQKKKLKVIFELENNTGLYCKYKRVGLSTKKIEDLGWNIAINLKEGLERTLKSFNEV